MSEMKSKSTQVDTKTAENTNNNNNDQDAIGTTVRSKKKPTRRKASQEGFFKFCAC